MGSEYSHKFSELTGIFSEISRITFQWVNINVSSYKVSEFFMNLSVSDYICMSVTHDIPTFNVGWTLDIMRCNNANGRFTNSLSTLCPLNQAWPRCSSCWAYLHICWGITTITISSSHHWHHLSVCCLTLTSIAQYPFSCNYSMANIIRLP